MMLRMVGTEELHRLGLGAQGALEALGSRAVDIMIPRNDEKPGSVKPGCGEEAAEEFGCEVVFGAPARVGDVPRREYHVGRPSLGCLSANCLDERGQNDIAVVL